MLGPGWFGPGIMRHRNIYSYFIQRAGGRLYGIAKTGQQEYDDALILYGMNPSVTNPMHTFYASLARSGPTSSRDFHASLSDGCTITWSFSRTHSLCHLMCLVVFFEINNHFIRGVRGMQQSCLWAVYVMTVFVYDLNEPQFMSYPGSKKHRTEASIRVPRMFNHTNSNNMINRWNILIKQSNILYIMTWGSEKDYIAENNGIRLSVVQLPQAWPLERPT
jgi:hypothetical protein